jgi:hypothetical protein
MLFIAISNLTVSTRLSSVVSDIQYSFTYLFFSTDILIDHLGKLKFSDFGAAKILAKGQKTMGKTTMNVNVNSLTGTPMYMVIY